GDLLVSQPQAGHVVALHADRDGDGRPDGRSVLLKELSDPHGIDILDDDGSGTSWLYVAEGTRVQRVAIDQGGSARSPGSGGAVRASSGAAPSPGGAVR